MSENENEEKIIMFAIDEKEENLCMECGKENAFISSDGLYKKKQ